MPKRIFITGYYGFLNTGDEAILIAMVAHLRELRPDLQITATSATPETTAAALGIDAVLWSDAYAMLEAVRGSDLVIIGGGGLFHDYWGFNPDTFLTNNHSGISFCAAPAAMAALYEKPVMLYAVGVGPLLSDHARTFTKMACDVAAAITVRDAGSKRTLESIAVTPDRITITADPAFGLPVEENPADIESLTSLNEERPRVAVALRQWSVGIDSKVWEHEAAAGLDRFLEQHPGSVWFVPFQRLTSIPEDDTLIARRVQALMKHKSRTAVLTSSFSPQQIVAVLRKCNLVVGMRLHSLILGMLADVPLLALSYDSKVDEVMGHAGLGSFNLDVRSFDAVTLASKMEEALAAKILPPVEGFADAARQNARIAIQILDRGAKQPNLSHDVLALLGRGIHAQLRESHNLRRTYQDVFAQQNRILAERDTGIAFLRNEVAARNKILAERNRAVEFLKNEVAGREAELARLRSEIELRDEIIRDREDAIQFLQKEIAARDEGIMFLRAEISQRETVISERQRAIEFLQQEVAARDATVAAQLEGIAFLRGEVAQRDAIIAARDRQLLESEAEIARLSDTVRDLEATLPWLRRWLLGRSRREGA